MTIAYLNGKFLPLNEARVPVMDRGFLFGDGIYEVFAAYDGKLFGEKPHFLRLKDSLNTVRIMPPWDEKELAQILKTLIEKNTFTHQMVYLQITRGVVETRGLPFPETVQPTLFAYSTPFTVPPIETLAEGIGAITLENTRWRQCRTKSTSLLANILLRQQAVDAGADEAILLEDGYAVEGTSSNLFIIKDKAIFTPPLNNHLLGGITREYLIDLFQQKQMDLHLVPITLEQLKNADEIWLTGTTREISPVIELDSAPVGDGKSGPLWHTAITSFRQYRETLLNE